jgi:hypothetical protein
MTDFTDYVECALDPVGAADRIRALIAERDRYRAVLEAAGYGDLDGIGSASLDHCWALGAEVARRSMVVIIERDRVRRLYHAEAETAHAEMDRADRAEAEVERLRDALSDLVSWFPDKPSQPEWRIRAGEHGADDAVAAARAALSTENTP